MDAISNTLEKIPTRPRMAVSVVQGIQSQGVIATVKHFARITWNTAAWITAPIVDERTLREIYLPAFEPL